MAYDPIFEECTPAQVNQPIKDGLVLFRDSTDGFVKAKRWDGSIIVIGGGGSSGWLLDGNTNGALRYIGTNDAFHFPIRTNGVEVARFLTTGEFVIGTTIALATLTIDSNAPVTSPISALQNAVGDIEYYIGNGTPEAVVTATRGSEYTDLLTGDLWKKTTAVGNTGWVKLDSSAIGEWLLDGNTNGAVKYIGTNDAFDFPIYTNGVQVAQFNAVGGNLRMVNNIEDSAGVLSIRPTTRILTDATGIFDSVDWGNRRLFDSGAFLSLDWQTRELKDATAVRSLNWTTRIGYDATNVASINWASRILEDSAGVSVFNWINTATQGLGILNVGSVNTAFLKTSLLTANRTYEFPDASGTLMLTTTGWSTLGNAGLVAGTNFLGTTDAVDLVFKTTNVERARINATGELGIGGTAVAGILLEVFGTIRQEPFANVKQDTAGFAKIATAGAGTTSVGLIPVPASSGVIIEAYIISRKTSGAGAGVVGDANGYIRTVKAKNVGGVVTIGTIQSSFTSEDISAFNATLSVSGTNISVDVSGSINNNADWDVMYRITYLT